MEFKNKTVIITGASVGIGKATALDFAKRGANVCIIDINKDELDVVKKEIEAIGAEASAYICDISDEKAVDDVTKQIVSTYKKVDVLVNNAGLWRFSGPFVETDKSLWEKLVGVNVYGTMQFCKAVLPSMIENKYGRIINVGSVAGKYGNRNMATYSMTKGAISAFTKALAKEVAEFSITVNNIVPGTVRNEGTPMENPMSYMGRNGELYEYSNLICFLAGEKAAYISGQDYQIDGCRKQI